MVTLLTTSTHSNCGRKRNSVELRPLPDPSTFQLACLHGQRPNVGRYAEVHRNVDQDLPSSNASCLTGRHESLRAGTDRDAFRCMTAGQGPALQVDGDLAWQVTVDAWPVGWVC